MRNLRLKSLRQSAKLWSVGFVSASLLITAAAQGTPMDPNVMPVPFEVPEDLSGYLLLRDHNDPTVVYVGPREGRLAVDRGLPRLSYAVAARDGAPYGIMNALFDFSIDSEGYKNLRDFIKSQAPHYGNWKLQPMPWVQTTPDIAVAGFGNTEDVCFEAEDIITGETVSQCLDLVYRSLTSAKGPTLGERVAVSLILSPAGVDLAPALLKGGAGLMMNLKTLYRAAHPAYSATIDVDYKKLYESYEWYAGYHDFVCVDVAISDFFERESLCGENGRNANGRECSVRISYTNNLGEEVKNLFAYVPSPDEPQEHQDFYRENAEKIKIFHSAIESLQQKFEDEMLTPIQGRKASVSKNVSYGYALRADRSRSEIEKHFSLTRKTVGGVITKSSVIPAATACLNLDGQSGAVSRDFSGDCQGYWSGQLRVAEVLPVEPSLAKDQSTSAGDFPFDL